MPVAPLGAVRRKKPSCAWVQQDLHSYLSTNIDPYDFTYYLPEWGGATDTDLSEEPQVEDLTPEQLTAFTAWLQNEHKGSEYAEQDPYGSPPYLTLSSAGPVPPGTWLIHFTDEGPFRSFTRGTKLYGLHLSTWAKSNATAACATNLSPDHGLFETVFGFAFDAMQHGVVRHGQKYGQNAVLFQCDCAVKAYHNGDEEDQVIFPLCSEYNVVPFRTEGNYLVGQTEAGDEVSFASPAEAIAHIQKNKGLGGLRGLGY